MPPAKKLTYTQFMARIRVSNELSQVHLENHTSKGPSYRCWRCGVLRAVVEK